jgi:hypothetical protein
LFILLTIKKRNNAVALFSVTSKGLAKKGYISYYKMKSRT